MKKAKRTKSDDLRAGYTAEDFPKGFTRGKYAARFAKESNPEHVATWEEVKAEALRRINK